MVIISRPCAGIVPWFGYHHVLMVLVALAIILLCKSVLSFGFVHPYNANSALTHSLFSTYPASISSALLLAGCSSPSPLIPGIFLLSLYYKQYTPTYDPAQVDPGVTAAIANIVGQAQLEVRVGFFGICVTPDGGGFLCSNNATALAQRVSVDQDPMNLIWVAKTFKDSIVFPYLL